LTIVTMKTTTARRLLGALAVTALAAGSISAVRPPLKGVSYKLRMNTRLPAMMQQMQNGREAPSFLVKVKSAGKNARFEFDSVPQGTPIPAGDYMLFLESGRAIRVSPKEKLYDEAPNGLGGAGGPMSMLSAVAGRGGNGRQLEITGIDMDLQQLDDETLHGRQVRHYQLVAEFNIEVLNNVAPIRLEMETWTADLSPGQSIVNPFDLAGAVGTAAPNDPAAKLTTRLMAERKKMQGTPLKTSMTFVISGLGNGAVPPLEFGQTTEVIDLREIDIDPKDLDVPAGFTKREPRPGRGGPPGR
jgi:hypothetical protein